MARRNIPRSRGGKKTAPRGGAYSRGAPPRRARSRLRDFAAVVAAMVGILANVGLGQEISFWGYRFLIGVAAFFASFLVLYGAGTLLSRLATRRR